MSAMHAVWAEPGAALAQGLETHLHQQAGARVSGDCSGLDDEAAGFREKFDPFECDVLKSGRGVVPNRYARTYVSREPGNYRICSSGN